MGHPFYEPLGDYSNTKMFFFAHICFSTLGQTVTLTSPRWALRRRSISVGLADAAADGERGIRCSMIPQRRAHHGIQAALRIR